MKEISELTVVIWGQSSRALGWEEDLLSKTAYFRNCLASKLPKWNSLERETQNITETMKTL